MPENEDICLKIVSSKNFKREKKDMKYKGKEEGWIVKNYFGEIGVNMVKMNFIKFPNN